MNVNSKLKASCKQAYHEDKTYTYMYKRNVHSKYRYARYIKASPTLTSSDKLLLRVACGIWTELPICNAGGSWGTMGDCRDGGWGWARCQRWVYRHHSSWLVSAVCRLLMLFCLLSVQVLFSSASSTFCFWCFLFFFVLLLFVYSQFLCIANCVFAYAKAYAKHVGTACIWAWDRDRVCIYVSTHVCIYSSTEYLSFSTLT